MHVWGLSWPVWQKVRLGTLEQAGSALYFGDAMSPIGADVCTWDLHA